MLCGFAICLPCSEFIFLMIWAMWVVPIFLPHLKKPVFHQIRIQQNTLAIDLPVLNEIFSNSHLPIYTIYSSTDLEASGISFSYIYLKSNFTMFWPS